MSFSSPVINQPPQSSPDLSVILPCYCTASLALRSASELATFLADSPLTWEIIIVDDGGGDFSHDSLSRGNSIRLLKLPHNLGKGAAVRAGMLAASGRVRIFTDVDLPYDPDLLLVIAEYIQHHGFHLVIGDRTLPGSSYPLNVGWQRRLASALCSTLVGTMVTGGFFDTQCGLKGFRGDVAEAIFSHTRIDRFAFDVEVIYLALYHRLDIKRIPVQLRNNETSSVRLLPDAARMLCDILSIKSHQVRGAYQCPELQETLTREFEQVRTNSRQARIKVKNSGSTWEGS